MSVKDAFGVTLKVGGRCKTRSGREVYIMSLHPDSKNSAKDEVRVKYLNGHVKRVLARDLERY